MSCIKINIFGDFVTPYSLKNLNVSEDLSSLLKSSDLNVVNYEGALIKDSHPIEKTGPILNQHVDSVNWLISHDFGLFSLANNHTMDHGVMSLLHTIECLNNKTVGAGDWEGAYRPFIYTASNKKIAFLSFTHLEFGVLSDEWDHSHKYGTAWINSAKVNTLITNLKSDSDIIIALPHAGIEYEEQPLPEWRNRYRELIDLGCDAVIASHPHIIQGYEIYREKPICYSLGNFFFPKPIEKPQYWYYSFCAQLVIDEHKKISLNVVPLQFSDSKLKIVRGNGNYVETYLSRVNKTLNNENAYLEYINRMCLDKYDNYIEALGTKELIPLKMTTRFVKRIIRHLLGRKDGSIASLTNTIRCESHRFCLIRGLKLKYKLQ